MQTSRVQPELLHTGLMRFRNPLVLILLVFCDCARTHGAENVVAPEAEDSTSGLPPAPQRSDVWIAGTWTDAAMTEMAEKLQPTGMTGFTGREQTGQTAADEQEKKQAYGEHRKALARKLGMHKLHFSVHTYHHQPNFPDSARRIGIAGEPLRNAIAPRDSTRDSTGRNWSIYCKSHDEFRDAVIANIQAAIDSGAAVIHFEDFFREETHCVCQQCAEKFRQALQHDPRLAGFREPLHRMSIHDFAQFDIRQCLAARTRGDESERRRQFTRMGTLWRAWSAFKDQIAFDFLNALCDAGREHARMTGREVAFVQHFWYFKPQDLATSDAYDGVWPETPLRHYGAQASQRSTDPYRLGIAVYPPAGIMGSAASVLRGAFRCPPIFTGFGGDWYHKLPFKRGPFARLLQVWTAEVYASGGTMQYLYHLPEKQLLGRELYRKLRANLLPEYFDGERSPSEYRCPLDAVGQYTRFIRAHPDFYDGCAPPPYVLLLKTERGYRLGNGGENVYAWAQLLDDAHIPYRVLLDGGDRKPVRLQKESLREYRHILALGEPEDYVASQLEALRHHAAGGSSVIVVGDPEGWREYLPGNSLTVIREDLGIRYQLEGRPAKSTEEIRRSLQATAIATNAGPNVLVKLERLAETPDWRLHVVNRKYHWLQDEVEEMSNVTITLDAGALGLGQVTDVRAFSPDGEDTTEVCVQASHTGPRFTLPRLSIYTVITFRSG